MMLILSQSKDAIRTDRSGGNRSSEDISRRTALWKCHINPIITPRSERQQFHSKGSALNDMDRCRVGIGQPVELQGRNVAQNYPRVDLEDSIQFIDRKEFRIWRLYLIDLPHPSHPAEITSGYHSPEHWMDIGHRGGEDTPASFRYWDFKRRASEQNQGSPVSDDPSAVIGKRSQQSTRVCKNDIILAGKLRPKDVAYRQPWHLSRRLIPCSGSVSLNKYATVLRLAPSRR